MSTPGTPDSQTVIAPPSVEANTAESAELTAQIPFPAKVGAAVVLFFAIVSRIIPHFRLIFFTIIWTAVIVIGLLLLLVTSTVQRRKASESANQALKNVKPLAFTQPSKFAAELNAIRRDESFLRAALYPPSAKISKAIDDLIALIIKDFVSSWYQRITPDPAFSNQVEKTIRHVLYGLWGRAEKLNLVELVVGRIVPLLTIHLNEFASAETAVRGKHLNKQLTESEELDIAIASKYRDGRLHPAVSLAFSDLKNVQQEYLRKIIARILPVLLPAKEVRSRSVAILIREIVSCSVMMPVLFLMSDPDTWNRLMETIGRSTLQERKTVRKLRAALDKHTTPDSKHYRFIRLTPKADERTFERFIRTIRTCHNLPDAKRMRNELMIQLRRDADFQDQVYLKRLETAKRLLDQKVGYLSSSPQSPGLPTLSAKATAKNIISQVENHSLLQILKNSSGISYFMEYMDRQHRIKLVQFWMVVDGMRNPLEDDPVGDEASVPASLTWTGSDRNDIGQIYEAYMSVPELGISDQSKQAIKRFLKLGRNASNLQYYHARGVILRAQTAIYDDMQEHDLPGFKKSDLFFKYAASDDHATPREDVPHPSQTFSQNNAARPTKDLSRNSSTLHFKAAGTLERSDLFPSRHSHDEKRPKLFDDDWETNDLSQSRGSLKEELFSDSSLQDDPISPSNGVVEAMEAALNNIMEERPSLDDSRRPSTNKFSEEILGIETPDSGRSSSELSRPPRLRPAFSERNSSRKKPTSLATLGLVNDFASKSVFANEDIFAEENAKALEDQGALEDRASDDEDTQVHEAAPGDLGLAEAISELTMSINKLYTQDSVVTSMLKKAELTNNTAELRILNKSKSSLQREIRRKELQRQQYIIQESDNSLYGRSSISIKQPIVGYEQGKEYAIYVIEVHRKAGDQFPAAEWVVTRRYSEFFQLHQDLRAKYGSVKHLEFPRKHVVMKLQKDFLDKRRAALETYLRSLLLIPDVCRSRELRSFLSQQSLPPAPDTDGSSAIEEGDFISKLYNSIADGMGDVIGTVPVLEQLSAAASSFAGFPALNNMNLLDPENQRDLKARTAEGGEMSVAEAEAELIAYENKEGVPFVKPICDIFLEVFDLNKGSSWLKGRAVVVVLHQLLGGTIERKVREQIRLSLSEENIEKYVHLLRDSLWVDGSFVRDRSPRTGKEKAKSRTEASLMLATLIPDLAASVVGRSNASNASRRLFAVFNNERLNCHMAFVILDVLIDALFPELR